MLTILYLYLGLFLHSDSRLLKWLPDTGITWPAWLHERSLTKLSVTSGLHYGRISSECNMCLMIICVLGKVCMKTYHRTCLCYLFCSYYGLDWNENIIVKFRLRMKVCSSNGIGMRKYMCDMWFNGNKLMIICQQ